MDMKGRRLHQMSKWFGKFNTRIWAHYSTTTVKVGMSKLWLTMWPIGVSSTGLLLHNWAMMMPPKNPNTRTQTPIMSERKWTWYPRGHPKFRPNSLHRPPRRPSARLICGSDITYNTSIFILIISRDQKLNHDPSNVHNKTTIWWCCMLKLAIFGHILILGDFSKKLEPDPRRLNLK